MAPTTKTSDATDDRRHARRPSRTAGAGIDAVAGALGQPVEDDREDDDGESGLEGRPDVDRSAARDRIARPGPGAPMSAVMTTIESAIMIVWLTPMPIVRRASGSWTLVRTCQRVEPSETAASTVVGRHPADAERGDPDRRRDRVDERRDRRRRRADQEEQGDRGEVGERRHDLHDVEDRA